MTAHSRLALIFFSNSPNRLSSSAFHSRVAAITFSSSSSSSVGLKVSLPDHSSPAESTQMGKKKKGKQKRDIDTNPIVSDASILETRVTNLHISDNPNSSANTYVASTSTPNSPHHAVSSRASSSSSQTFGANPMGIWRPKGLATSAGATPVAGYSDTLSELRTDHKHEKKRGETTSPERLVAGFSSIAATKAPKVRHPIGVDFNVDSTTYSRAKVRATFYPKFENEKSDQEVRNRMIEMVGNGQATLEVTLKHSGSLFMYAGAEGGAYAKNSYGNIYTAVGVFVLGRIFLEAWGTEATKKQKEFNEFLEKNRTCISMELVTAVLGDHGQRPLEDYVVVTAVTELGNGKPRFYSTPDIIAFCRRWQLPTNHVWLFSSRKSAASFFAAFDALCEEGTATPVCKALDEVADISVPASKDHIEVQGEILEGLVARIVSQKSVEHLKNILSEYPAPQLEGAGLKMGSSLREVCRTNRNDEKQQIRALLQNVGTAMCPNHSDWFGNEEVGIGSRSADRSVLSKFLQAHPADYDTLKLQEIIRLMRLRRFQAAFKCYYNFNKFPSKDNIYLKMVIHVHNDSVFRRYHKEMRQNTGLWPLYRGFFVDFDLFKVSKETANEMARNTYDLVKPVSDIADSNGTSLDGFADEDANLMIKLKFLTYKLRTFLIRNGLPILFREGPAAYKKYYLRQMEIWGTSHAKRNEMSKMLDEWAVYIRRKCGNKQLRSSTYLTEAEPFLAEYARRSVQNRALIGSAGNLIRAEDFLAIVEGGRDEEGDLEPVRDVSPVSPIATTTNTLPKEEGLIVFFPGIPGCAKSALCREIMNVPGGLGDGHPIESLMGDLIKAKYWQKVADERRKKPQTIILADKNAPNEEVWRLIENMSKSTRATAVPVIPDSEGTVSNPFSLDALAVFIYRVLHRVNHPGNLDGSSPNAGYVLLMFYNLYEGKDRREFESELSERFGNFIKMPLLRSDWDPLPDPIRIILEKGLDLYKLHNSKHGKLESTKGTYAKNWVEWERRLRAVLAENSDYITSIQVPFDYAGKTVLDKLNAILKGEVTPSTEKRKFGNIVYAAVTLPAEDIKAALEQFGNSNPKVKELLERTNPHKTLQKAHVTLAHKRSHGVIAVASYGVFLNENAPVELTALLFSQNLAAFEVRLGTVDGQEISPKNEWPHLTLWYGEGASAKDANMLPKLHLEGQANRIELEKPVTVTGVVEFY